MLNDGIFLRRKAYFSGEEGPFFPCPYSTFFTRISLGGVTVHKLPSLLPITILTGIFFSMGCYFTVDWSSGRGPNGKERAVIDDTPDAEEANLSKSELSKKGKAGRQNSGQEDRSFDLTSGQGGSSSSTRNCSALYNNCKDKCWKDYPTPKVETVFTAVTIDRKRSDCVGRCSNVCDHFEPASSGGPMPNSGKGNYSDPSAPRY